MAIYSQALSYDIIAKFKEIILPTLTAQQKKICLVVSLVFSFLAVCYVVKRYYFKAQLLQEENIKDNVTPIFHSKEQPKTPSRTASPPLSSLTPQEIKELDVTTIEEEEGEIFEVKPLEQEFEPQDADKKESYAIESLPEDLLVHIFKQLDFENWKTLCYINKNFNKLSLHPAIAAYLLEKNLIPHIPDNKKVILKCIESAASCLSKVNLEDIELTKEEMKNIFSLCPNLKELDLSRTKLSDTTIDEILIYLPPHLNSLNLKGCNINDRAMQHLKALTALQSLDLLGCYQITDNGLLHLQVLTNLQFLNLSRCEKISDNGLFHLKTLTALQSLDLLGCKKITDNGLLHLQVFTNLQSLNLRECEQITDNGLLHLKTLTALQSLNLQGCNQITDNGLLYLQTLTALQSLTLGSQITDNGLLHLKALTALQSLNLGRCRKITDNGLKDFKKAFPSCIVMPYQY